jgi:hypothetical protein
MRTKLGNCEWETIDFVEITEITDFPMGTGYPFHVNRARRESGQFTAWRRACQAAQARPDRVLDS